MSYLRTARLQFDERNPDPEVLAKWAEATKPLFKFIFRHQLNLPEDFVALAQKADPSMMNTSAVLYAFQTAHPEKIFFREDITDLIVKMGIVFTDEE